MSKIKTRIISAFPGTGKTYFSKDRDDVLDSDSSNFSWLKDDDGKNTKERNPDFPQNYIDHIKKNIGKYAFILVSSHKEVRVALQHNCLFYYLVYPDPWSKTVKDIFIQRYRDRGNNKEFITLLESNYKNWARDCSFDVGCKQIMMSFFGNFQYLSDELRHLVAAENGDKLEEDTTERKLSLNKKVEKINSLTEE